MSDDVFTGKIYSCKPVAKLKLGRFYFVDGILRLENKADIEEMGKNLEALATSNPGFRAKIRTISMDAAEAVIAARTPEAISGAATSASAIPTVHEAVAQEAAAKELQDAPGILEPETAPDPAPQGALKLGS